MTAGGPLRALRATEIGDLPVEWDMQALGTVARVYSGGTPSRAIPEYWGPPIPWVTTTEVDFGEIRSTSEQITQAGLANSAAKVAPAGTLLIAMYGQGKTRGKTAILGIDAAMNQACAAIEVGKSVSPRYFFHYLISSYDRIRALSNSGGQENLSGEIVKRILVPVPSRPEQVRIEQVLDDADDQIATLDRLIEKKQAIIQGMMQQLLTGKTRIPGFKEPWAEVRLGDYVNYVKTVALSRAQLDSRSPLRYLHYGDIHTRSSVTLDAANEDMPRARSALARNAGRLQVGDVVFADASEDTAGVGKSVEIISAPRSGVIPGLHTIAARFDKAVLADGFKAYLQFMPPFRNSLLRLAAGTKVLATTRSYISSITLQLPRVEEQQAITKALRDANDELIVIQERLKKARDLKQGMMQQLLTGRTRLPVAGMAS